MLELSVEQVKNSMGISER